MAGKKQKSTPTFAVAYVGCHLCYQADSRLLGARRGRTPAVHLRATLILFSPFGHFHFPCFLLSPMKKPATAGYFLKRKEIDSVSDQHATVILLHPTLSIRNTVVIDCLEE
jgi:hypothetical protein